jgi:omega-hydroxy-beta-dihydromenaquinone-9 sulfotransferase
MPGFPWHRVFHPLCGADPVTLAGLVARRGLPSPAGAHAFAIACACALARLPFTVLERGLERLPAAPMPPPVFIVGHPRSGTTHLHNLMAASGAFATVPPVLAAMPWERRTLAPILRPFIDPYLPETRLIDGVALPPDAPTEDEVGLANLAPQSYFHAIYFPRAFAEDYRRLLAGEGPPSRARARAVRRYVAAMAWRQPRPLLLKNPAYTVQVAALAELLPSARFVHIHRDPRAIFASTRRTLRRVLGELALQKWRHVDIDEVVLDTYPRVLAALRHQAAALPAGAFAEVAFEDVVAAPGEVLRDLWRRLDLPGDAAALARVEAYVSRIRGYRAAPARLTRCEEALVEQRWSRELALYGGAASPSA